MAEVGPEANKLSVFVSYSREDLAFADQLVVTLELAGFAPTIDRLGIRGAENWEQKLQTLIREADTVVFALSPASATSKVCCWEVEQAVAMGKRIIPVLCKPLASAAPPPTLAALNYIYFYAEPSHPGSGWAVGMRELDKALRTDLIWLREHTRLLQRAVEWDAGDRVPGRLLLGGDIGEARAWVASQPREAPAPAAVQLAFIAASEAHEAEQANQRERALAERERLVQAAEASHVARERAQAEALAAVERERIQAVKTAQRTMAGLVVASMLLAVACGTGLWAWVERERAVANQRLAEAQKSRANQAIEASTNLANGLIFDLALRFKGTQGVPQSLVRDLLQKVKSLTDELARGGEPTPELLHYRAAAFHELASVLRELGDSRQAVEVAEAAAAIAERLAASDPARMEWQRDLSLSYSSIADALLELGQRAEAIIASRKSLAIAEKIAAADPTRADWQRGLLVCYHKVGNILQESGKLDEALVEFRKSLLIAEKLSVSYPDRTEWQYDLAVSHDRMGLALLAIGQRAEGLIEFRKSLTISQKLAVSDAARTEWQRGLAVSYDRIGTFLQATGQLNEALVEFHKSLAIAEKLATSDPTRADWQHDLSLSYDRIGSALLATGQRKEALIQFRKSLTVAQKFAASDPASAKWQRAVSVSYVNVANAGFEPVENIGNALAILKRMKADDTMSPADEKFIGMLEDRIVAVALDAKLQAANEEAEAGRYGSAMRLYFELATEVEAAEVRVGGKPTAKTASMFNGYAYYALLAREPAMALAAAERAHGLVPDDLEIETNRVHALMFVGRAEEARALHLAHKELLFPNNGNKSWRKIISEDFATFRKAGIEHSQMIEIETSFATGR